MTKITTQNILEVFCNSLSKQKKIETKNKKNRKERQDAVDVDRSSREKVKLWAKMHALFTCNVHIIQTRTYTSIYIYIHIYSSILSIISRQRHTTHIYIYVYVLHSIRSYSLFLAGPTGSYVVSFDVASLHASYICFNAMYTTILEHHCLFVHHRLWPNPLFTPFFSATRFFIPARYPRSLDSLTLRGQKKKKCSREEAEGGERGKFTTTFRRRSRSALCRWNDL